MRQKKHNYKSLYVIPAICGVLLWWYYSTNSVMEQLLILFIFFTMVLPFSLQCYSSALTTAIKPIPKKDRVVYDKKKSVNSKGEKNTYKSKTINNPNYIALRDTIKYASQNSQLTRTNILMLKAFIDCKLGENVIKYTNFNFSNDMHEIFCKLKSSSFSDEDYESILSYTCELIEPKIVNKEIV